MEIRVIYRDNCVGRVKDYLLEGLLRDGAISAFWRASGWVDVDRDPIRQGKGDYAGPERRRREAIATYFG
jgi:hypothetical protein